MMMRYAMLILGLVGLLAAFGCVAQPAVDPYSLQAQGESLVKAAQSLQTATAQVVVLRALDQQAAQAQISGDATATALNLAANVQQTTTALDLAALQGQATQTQQAQISQATATQQAIGTQQALTATQQALDLQAQQDRAEIARFTRWIYAALLVIVLIVALVVAVWAVATLVRVYRKNRSQFPEDMVQVLDTQYGLAVINPSRMATAGMMIGKDGVKELPAGLSDAQVTARAQLVRMVQALPEGFAVQQVGAEQAAAGGPTVEILQPGAASDVAAWLTEVQNKLLETTAGGDR